ILPDREPVVAMLRPRHRHPSVPAEAVHRRKDLRPIRCGQPCGQLVDRLGALVAEDREDPFIERGMGDEAGVMKARHRVLPHIDDKGSKPYLSSSIWMRGVCRNAMNWFAIAQAWGPHVRITEPANRTGSSSPVGCSSTMRTCPFRIASARYTTPTSTAPESTRLTMSSVWIAWRKDDFANRDPFLNSARAVIRPKLVRGSPTPIRTGRFPPRLTHDGIDAFGDDAMTNTSGLWA